MNSKKIIIESLAMDLKRVALGLNRKSFKMANRFKEEVLKRDSELAIYNSDNHLKKLLVMIKERLKRNDGKAAEDALMLSTLVQNYALKNLK